MLMKYPISSPGLTKKGHDISLIEVMPLGETDEDRFDQYIPLDLVQQQLESYGRSNRKQRVTRSQGHPDISASGKLAVDWVSSRR
jgi:molybdenum cofactor biosynthesis enzyme MoaA